MDPVQSVQVERQIHKGRWGFYPCSYETYALLRELARLHRAAYKDFRCWVRWSRKSPANRVHWAKIRNELNQPIGWKNEGPVAEPNAGNRFFVKSTNASANNYWQTKPRHRSTAYDGNHGIFTEYGILEDYHRARHPKSSQELVEPLRHSHEELKEILEKIKAG